MNITGNAPAGGVDPSAPATVAVAAKQLSQTKQDGANAVALIQSANALPAPDGVRGSLVNKMA